MASRKFQKIGSLAAGELRFLLRDDAPAAWCIDVYAEDAELAAELVALGSAAFRAKAGNGGDVTVNLNLNIGAVNEAIGIG